MLLITAELRWFFRGRLPQKVGHWFQAESTPTFEGSREDLYFNLMEGDALGVKAREGKLEIKHRTEDLGLKTLSENISGHLEKWAKWSFEIAEEEINFLKTSISKDSWISVKKSRWLKRYEACNVELTEIEVDLQNWWTLGFEAFGKESNIVHDLQIAVEQSLINNPFPIALKAADSFSYPKWLRDFSKHK